LQQGLYNISKSGSDNTGYFSGHLKGALGANLTQIRLALSTASFWGELVLYKKIN
jgi:hypothetical protein